MIFLFWYLEGSFTIKAEVVRKFFVENRQKLPDEDEVVGQTDAEIVIEIHVIEQFLTVSRERLAAE